MAETEPTQPVNTPDADKFPALKKLARGRRRRVPYVQQMQWTDCGAACVAMVLGYLGKPVKLDEVREVAGVDRDGVSMLSILRAGEWFGLRGRGLKLDIDSVQYLPTGTILHWDFNHFVVLERFSKRGVNIVDPAHGRRFIPIDQFRKLFTGVALILEPTEVFEPGDPDRGRLWSYLRQLLGQKHLISRVLVTSLLLRLFALSLPILTGLIVDRVVPRGDRSLLIVVGIGLGGVVMFQFLSALIRAHLLLQLRTNLDTKMTLGFIDYLVDLPYAFFQRRSAGDLMMRVNSNATIRELLTANTLSAVLDGMMVMIYLLLIFLVSPEIGLIVMLLGAAQIIVYLASARRYRDLMAQNLEAQAKSQGYLVQVMAGIETLKSSGAENRAVEHWSNLFVDELNISLQRGRLSAVVESLMSSLRTASPLLIMSYGTLMVMNGELSLGMMLALNALAVGFLTPLSTLVSSGLQLQLLGGYIERIDDVLSAEPEQDRSRVAHAPKMTGQISVENVSFRYGPHAAWAVKDIQLDIVPGEAIAIVGKSGSGKSTLAKLLLGLYPPSEGRITYDSHDLAELSARSVRRQLGIVPQHPYIFGSSVRENIALTDPTLPMDKVVDAAKNAHIHDDIIAMPMGYETIVADGGASLSGGQRQRLAVARALVHEPAIVLLDEATSSLDTTTEQVVQRNLEALQCTRIVIAHRLSTIVNSDRIIVMQDGRIVEQGSHAELLDRGGAYSVLVAAQATQPREPHQ